MKTKVYRLFMFFALVLGLSLPGAKANAGGTLSALPSVEPANELLQYTADGHVLGFAPDKVYLAGLDHALTVSFVGGQRVQPQGMEGSGESKGSAAPLGKVSYKDIWPGVDVVYTAIHGGIVESAYLLAPGAKSESIRLKYNVPVELMKDGTLQFAFENGYLTESAPVAWQEIGGKRVAVDVRFEKRGESEVGFVLGAFDSAYGVTIDPGYSWHTFYGSASNSDEGNDIAVDSSGNVYVVGMSNVSWNGPGSVSPLNIHHGSVEIVVVKLNDAGTYQWHTFFGSTSYDYAKSVALDGSGNVFVTGSSYDSWNGPGGVAPLHGYSGNDPVWVVHPDIVVIKLNGDGVYQWHTFYGTTNNDFGNGITTDLSGNVYVTGFSFPWNGPGGAPPLNAATVGDYGSELVVIKLDSIGAYQWHTFYGSTGGDLGNSVATDDSGNLYLTGMSSHSWNGPGDILPLHAYNGSAFTNIVVLKLNSVGAYQWHTFYASSNGDDYGNGIGVDGGGNVYVAARSDGGSWNGPGGEAPLNAGMGNWLVIKLDNVGAYQWHSHTGGTAKAIYVTDGGDVYVTGEGGLPINGPNGETPLNAFYSGYDVIMLKLNSAGVYQWHTYYGSIYSDYVNGIVVNGSGNIYITGYSDATWNGPGDTAPLNAFTSSSPGIGNSDFVVIKMSRQTPIDLSLNTSSVNENQPAGTTVGTLNATDLDAGDRFTYTFCGGVDDASFTLAVDTLNAAGVFDYETKNSYSVCVRSTDLDGLYFDKTFAITVTDINENSAPADLTLSASSVDENLPADTTIGSFTTTDPDAGDTFTYSFCGGADDASFSITSNTLNTAAVFDYETKNSYSICVRSTDSGSLTFDKTFVISVTDVVENSVPTNLSISASTVAENLPAASTVGSFTTADPDTGDTFSYSLVSGTGSDDNAAFMINGNELKTAFPFNYLAKNSYSIRVRITDSGNLTYEKAFTITVTDAPPIFADVPDSYWAVSWIERLYNNGITGGCSTSPLNYCPDSTVTRAQMAIFLLKGIHSSSYTPPAVGSGTGFTDVPTDYWAAAWIKQLVADGITSGCGIGIYCPDSEVTRAQMAVFLLKSEHGISYSPPDVGAGTGFTDVPSDYWAAAWIKQLAAEGITGGCGSGNYCPDSPVTRAQMAVFLVKTFNLP